MRKQQNITHYQKKRQLAEFSLEMTEVFEQTRILNNYNCDRSPRCGSPWDHIPVNLRKGHSGEEIIKKQLVVKETAI